MLLRLHTLLEKREEVCEGIGLVSRPSSSFVYRKKSSVNEYYRAKEIPTTEQLRCLGMRTIVKGEYCVVDAVTFPGQYLKRPKILVL